MVGIFQGRQEAGPRALGNRSILFNPMHIHAKEIVNTFKKENGIDLLQERFYMSMLMTGLI
jgi:predicted NodU family carbamoyl transferase